MEVTAFDALRDNLPITALYGDFPLIIRKLDIVLAVKGRVLTVTGNYINPSRIIESPVKPYSN